MWAAFIFYGTGALFVSLSIAALFHLRWVQRLPTLAALSKDSPNPSPALANCRCSVVVAARDEEARIESTVRRILDQRGVQLELVVVDDRSRDGTPDILHRLAADDPRVQIQTVGALPDGWLGKCHACHLGATAATGDWILFTDADCWLKPDVIARALLLAEREGVDHVTLTGLNSDANFGARAWYLLFLLTLSNWFSGANRDRPGAHMGIGAFNLVRADTYRRCGGYQALRLTVLDDIKLGLLVRRAGKKTRAFVGADDVECHWGRRVRDQVRVMEKNYFAVTEFRLGLVLLGSLATLVVCAILGLGLFSGTAAGLFAALSPLTLIVPAAILADRVGWPRRSALLSPLMILVFLYALLNSTWLTVRQGCVRWRDTFYSLEILRAGGVR